MPALKNAKGTTYANICAKSEVQKTLNMLLEKSGSRQVFEATVLELKKLGLT